MNKEKILIIEDEEDLANILGDYLTMEGYETRLSYNGENGLKQFKEYRPDLIILDIMLPVLDGIEVCKRVREESDVPILILSAKSGEMDKVISLGIGADDYVTKPFSASELIARVKAHLRRYKVTEKKEVQKRESCLNVGKLRLYRESYEVRCIEDKLDLTTKEFQVLYFFARHEGKVFSKEQIYDQIWGMKEFGDISSVAVYIKRLRKKLAAYELDYIKTVWGVGYKFVVEQ